MLLGRCIALIFLVLMVMVAGAEGLRMLQGENNQWITISQAVGFAFGTEIAESAVTDVPALPVLAGLWLLFFLISKRK